MRLLPLFPVHPASSAARVILAAGAISTALTGHLQAQDTPSNPPADTPQRPWSSTRSRRPATLDNRACLTSSTPASCDNCVSRSAWDS